MKMCFIVLMVFVCFKLSAQDNAAKYFLVRTIGPLPFMEYGLGEDRLGGAKMTFLDSNVVLKIIDSVGFKYKIQLSKYHAAYIDKTNVERLNGLKQKPYYLTSSWKV